MLQILKIYFIEFVNSYFEKESLFFYAKLLLELEWFLPPINQNMEDNIIRNNIKNNTKVQRKYISNYTNQRQYSEEFLNSLYANFK